MLHFAHQRVNIRVHHAHIMRNLVIIDNDLLQCAQALSHRLKHGMRSIQLRLLRHVHHARIGCTPHIAVVQLNCARNGFKQARFACAITAN